MTVYRLHGGRCCAEPGGRGAARAVARSALSWMADAHLTDTDKAHLARAIELAQQRRARGQAQPRRGRRGGTRRGGARRGLAREFGGAARRGQRDRGVRLGRPARRHAVRVARAVLSRGQDAAVHRGDPAGGDRAGGRRLRRPHREGFRARSRHPARRGRRGRDRRRRARRARAPAQPGVSQARPRWPSVGAVQVRDDARRQGRDPHRGLEVDQRRGQPRAGPSLARIGRRGGRRHRHGARGRPAADGAPRRTARRARASAATCRVRLARTPAAHLAARRPPPPRCR